MAEPFKNLLHAGTAAAMARHLGRVCGAFDAEAFLAVALPGLDALEFKARAMQLADALEAALPGSFDSAAQAIGSPQSGGAQQPGGRHGL
jgi:hypothetical protein